MIKRTANGLIAQSLGLQVSYSVLKGKIKQIIPIELERKKLIITGLVQSSSIILSFAIEIALKGLLKYRFGDFPKIHNLKKLFDKLDENDRIQISQIYKKQTDTDIEKCLERHKDMFMEFRYLELEIDEPNNNENVNIALNSIIDFYNLIKSKNKKDVL